MQKMYARLFFMLSNNPTSELNNEILEVLANLRKGAGMSQAEVARHVKVDQTRISKIENGIYPPSAAEFASILDAIGTDAAREFSDFLSQSFEEISRPSFYHPNRVALQAAASALTKLSELIERTTSSKVIPRLELVRGQLLQHAEHLQRTDYRIALLGEIGVGKTTALCVLSNLMVGKGISDGEIVLETGPGRTTLCDVQVEQGNQAELIVDPLSTDEILNLARDFCAGIWARVHEDKSQIQAGGVSQEMERAIRNMSSLTRPRRPKAKPGEPRPPTPPDPAITLAEDCNDFDAFVSGVWLRLDLPRRTLTTLVCPENESDPMVWLGKQFRKVNNGRHSLVSLPRLVRVRIPRPPIEFGDFEVSLIDTKGLDSTLSRPDLRLHRDDDRTLILICCGFKDAPSAAGEAFLRHAVQEGVEREMAQRGSILVLPKLNEAIEMKDDSGYPVETVLEGYELRHEQVEGELAKLEMSSLPVWFLNAARSEDIQPVMQQLNQQLRDVIQFHVDSIHQSANAVDQAIENYEQFEAEAAHEQVGKILKAFIEMRNRLASRRRQIHDRFLQDVGRAHPSTVWASSRRNGEWWNLSATDDVGAGTVVDARLRSQRAFVGLAEILETMLHDDELSPAHEHIRTLRDAAADWERRFLAQARSIGVMTYRNQLFTASQLWRECQQQYGRGSGYRDRVSRLIDTWFQEEDQIELQELVDLRLESAWQTEVIGPLAELAH